MVYTMYRSLRRRVCLLGACLAVIASTLLGCSAVTAGSSQAGRNAGLKELLAGKLFNDAQIVVTLSDINKMTVVPPGAGRVFVLKASKLTKYQVTLTATTLEDARGDPQFGTKDLINWPTEDVCRGAPLLAVAYREDQLPEHILPPVDLAMTSPRLQYKQLISNITRDCQALDDLASEDYPTDITYSGFMLDVDGTAQGQQPAGNMKSTWESYLALNSQMNELNTAGKPGLKQMQAWGAEKSLKFMSDAYGDQVYAARPQFASSLKNMLTALASGNAQQRQTALYDYYCNLFQAELANPVLNITLGPREGLQECAEEGARVFVFVYNCLVPDEISDNIVTNPELMVSVKLNILQTSAESACFTNADRFVLYLNWTTVVVAGVVALLFTVLFEIGPTVKDKLFRTFRQADHMNDSMGLSSGSMKRLQHWWRMLVDAMRTINSPSGYSRRYTILVTTTAALLVAAIVWQPALNPDAQHDHAWFSNPIGPQKDDVAKNKAADVEYYAKVMGISALIGYSVKLALLANLGVPDPGSVGIVVRPDVWKRQVVISIIGMVVLSLLVLSNASYMLNQSRAWVYPLPYMYLVITLILHYIASVVLFSVYTFIKPPPLASSSYRTLGPVCRSATPNSSSYDKDAARQESLSRKTSAIALKDYRRVLVNRLTALPRRLYQSVSEEEHLRYSSWILIPVWLSFCLVIFWYLMGVTRSDMMVHCVRNPQDCVGGQLKTWLGVLDATLDTDTVQQSMQVLQALDQQDLSAGVQLLQDISGSFNGSDAELAQIQQVAQTLNDMSSATQRLYKPYLSKTGPRLERWMDEAEKAYYAGRLLGYSLAVFFALASLFNILRTFKRILLHRYLKSLTPQQQDELIQELKQQDGTERGALARAMTLLRDRDSATPYGGYGATAPASWDPTLVHPHPHTHLDEASPGTEQEACNESEVQSNCYQHPPAAGAVGAVNYVDYPTGYVATSDDLHNSYSNDLIVATKSTPQAPVTFVQTGAWSEAAAAEAAAAVAAAKAIESAASVASKLSVKLPQEPGRSATTASVGNGNHVLGFHADNQGATTEIMYTIQMLEDDMAVFGIGASVALFGVLVSTMWVQIRVVGFILTIAATVLFHPFFWSQVMSRLWVSVVSLFGLVLFNMLVVKRLIGGQLLSDGTTIKHRGAWMTFYLMCQLAFLVIGVLYASWRVIWALIVMLLYSVACLDRSILIICKFLDGSYIAFVTSVKLEAAWTNISQQQNTAKTVQKEPLQQQAKDAADAPHPPQQQQQQQCMAV